MFSIESIDPKVYRTKSRNATLVMLGIFIVIGFIFASLSVHYLSPYNSNKLVLNFLGAFVGLLITAFIVKKFMANKPIMAEAMYGFRLKRNLMHVTNRLRHIQEAVAKGDQQAMKILRFYHLGLTQMHKFEQNSSALLDMEVDKRELESKMQEFGLELNQIEFDPEWVKDYQEDKDED